MTVQMFGANVTNRVFYACAELIPEQATQLTALKINRAVTKLMANEMNGKLLCIGSHVHYGKVQDKYRVDGNSSRS
ncbi:MAG: hypothetical protein LBD43_00130 [Holosporales bacterium]|nr:hypothetical protein [Holosporales bacterium]